VEPKQIETGQNEEQQGKKNKLQRKSETNRGKTMTPDNRTVKTCQSVHAAFTIITAVSHPKLLVSV
jgi:hypothetical protein